MKRRIIQENLQTHIIIFKMVDLLVFSGAVYLANRICFDNWSLLLSDQIAVLAGIIILNITFNSLNLYQTWRGQSLISEIRLVFFGVLILYAVLAMLAFALQMSLFYERGWAFLAFTFTFVLIALFRICSRYCLRYMRYKNMNIRTMCIIGAGELGQHIAKQVQNSPWTGLRVIGFFDDWAAPEQVINDVPVLGNFAYIKDFLELSPVDEIWVALPLKAEVKIHSIIKSLRDNTTDIRFVPDIFGFHLVNHSITDVAGLPVLNLSSSPMEGLNRIIKHIEDYVIGVLILILIFPVLVLVAIAVKCSSSGPILYYQKRQGFDGKDIVVYKFRTMYVQDENAPFKQATKNDSRITPIGSILRRSSFDELPQFINVLQGRMSIVGPRPHPIELNEQYKDKVDMYMQRHKVHPGITGWAQINGYRGEFRSAESIEKRIEYDLFYINNWSIWFDLKIIFLTLFKGFLSKSAY